MQSDLPKVLHQLCGQPMLSYVLEACREAGLGRLIVVVGHRRETVVETYAGAADLGVDVASERSQPRDHR